jgi:hypothetical protein
VQLGLGLDVSTVADDDGIRQHHLQGWHGSQPSTKESLFGTAVTIVIFDPTSYLEE